jgi:hypothetical protein
MEKLEMEIPLAYHLFHQRIFEENLHDVSSFVMVVLDDQFLDLV